MAGGEVRTREGFMKEALALARKGLGRTAPNPPVGCVIVRRGRIVGRGWHRMAGKEHAEVAALADARGAARGADAYITLEPCRHTGRTPPCTRALIEAGVRRVFVSVGDPDPRTRGGGFRLLRSADIEVVRGICADEGAELLAGFAHWVKTGAPMFHLKLAASLDGRIASHSGASKWISSVASRRIVQEMRNCADAVLVGIGTVLADDPRLTCRVRGGQNPCRIVLDPRLRTPTDARVLTGAGRLVIVCGSTAPAAKRRRLEAAGAEVIAAGRPRYASWPQLAQVLGEKGMHEVLVEGGAAVAASLLRAQMVNSMTIFYNPRLIGGDGIPLVGPLGVRTPKQALRLETVSVEHSGDDLVWRGRPAKR